MTDQIDLLENKLHQNDEYQDKLNNMIENLSKDLTESEMTFFDMSIITEYFNSFKSNLISYLNMCVQYLFLDFQKWLFQEIIEICLMFELFDEKFRKWEWKIKCKILFVSSLFFVELKLSFFYVLSWVDYGKR